MSNKITDIVNHINILRKANKNRWYQYTGMLNGMRVLVKGYNTWLQIFTIDGIKYGTSTIEKVGEYTNYLQESLEQMLNEKEANHA